MLGKLLKYEIPALGRKLVPLYIAWMAAALLLGISLSIGDSTGIDMNDGFTAVLTALVYVAIATAIGVMSVVLIIQRYRNSLLGDEGYFSNVLPVTAAEHILNKLLSAVIWMLITGVAALLTLTIIGLVAASVKSIIDPELLVFDINWKDLVEIIRANGLLVAELITLGLLDLFKTTLQIYTAITIGHQAQDKTTLASIGAYIGILALESTVARVLLIPAGLLLGEDASRLTAAASPVKVLPFSILFTLALSIIYFLVCKYFMEKKLNLN